MDEQKSQENLGKRKTIRIAALAVIGLLAAIILLTVVIFPRLEDFFLRKGFEFARIKMLAALPTPDGYNPDLHTNDPLEVEASLKAIHKALNIKALQSRDFMDSATSFMRAFRDRYGDQTILPDEIGFLVTRLNQLLRQVLRQHFCLVKDSLIAYAAHFQRADWHRNKEILGFDSIAIFNDSIRVGIHSALSLDLISEYFSGAEDGSIREDEFERMEKLIGEIERFQLRDEFRAVTQVIFKTEEFTQFPEAAQFRENARIILAQLRKPDFDYARIKPTLRSFIFLWYQTSTASEGAGIDLVSLYEFSRYASDPALQQQ